MTVYGITQMTSTQTADLNWGDSITQGIFSNVWSFFFL